MKLKKAASLSLAAALALSLAACGSSTGASDVPDGDGDPATLTVAMECAYAPYNWTQSDDANGAVQIRDSSDYAYGYDVMMAKKIARRHERRRGLRHRRPVHHRRAFPAGGLL